MPYIVLLFAHRKPGLSPASFKSHYESSHMPLIRFLAGPVFPKTHTRRYIHRTPPESGTDDTNNYPATVFVGTQADFAYDAISELVFDDEPAFQAFSARMGQGEAAERIAKDEEVFLDRARLRAVLVGDCIVTPRVTTDG